MKNIRSFLRTCLTMALLFLVLSGIPLRTKQKSDAQLALELVAKQALRGSWNEAQIKAAAYALGAMLMTPIADAPSKEEMLEMTNYTTAKIIKKRNEIYQALAATAPQALAAQQQAAAQQQYATQQQATAQQYAAQKTAAAPQGQYDQQQYATDGQYQYVTDPAASTQQGAQ